MVNIDEVVQIDDINGQIGISITDDQDQQTHQILDKHLRHSPSLIDCRRVSGELRVFFLH